MAARNSDRDLLFGVLALQMGFISKEQLVAAVTTWSAERGRGLDEILQEQGALAAKRRDVLDALVAEHLALHGDDPAASLRAIGIPESAREDLENVPDSDLHASLTHATTVPSYISGGMTMVPDGKRDAPSLASRFSIVRQHAKGGLGEVFLARDHELNREVALKEIQMRRAFDQDSQSRFVLEAEITGGLEHPGIVPVYGFGRYADGRPYYAMRFIRGSALSDAVARFHGRDRAPKSAGELAGSAPSTPEVREPTATPHRALRLHEPERGVEFRALLARFLDVCHAIDYAHSRGILHRDIKPANVMLGKFGETLVVDWGLAKPIGAAEVTNLAGERPLQPSGHRGATPTQVGSAIGTPAYMSPEQAAGRLQELGPASDVYSLGATLYHLLTGVAPIERSDIETMLRKVEEGEYPRPRALMPDVDRALEAICLKAMARDPAGRYASARALVADIEHWLADEPVAACPERWSQRTRRWVRRHWAFVQSAGIAVVLIAATAVTAAWLIDRARRETARARDQESAAKQAATANFRSAREAVGGWFANASTPLSYYPGTLALREELLQQTAEKFQTLLQDSTPDPALQLEQAKALIMLGEVHVELGDLAAAAQAQRRALDVLGRLAEAADLQLDVALERGRAEAKLGLALAAQGKEDEGLQAWQRAGQTLEPLMSSPAALAAREIRGGMRLWQAEIEDRRAHLDAAREALRLARGDYGELLLLAEQSGAAGIGPRAAALRRLAQICLQESDFESDAGKAAAARQLLGQAEQYLSALPEGGRDEPEDLAARADCRFRTAIVWRQLGRPDDELAAYRGAIDDYEELLDALPDVPRFQEALAVTLSDFSQALHEAGRTDEAAQNLTAARAILTNLARRFPQVLNYRLNAGAAALTLGQQLLDRGDLPAAQEALDDAGEIYGELAAGEPENLGYLLIRTSIELQQARRELAADEAEAALSRLDQVLAVFAALPDEDRALPDVQEQEAWLRQRRGETLHRLGRSEEARTELTQVLTLRKQLPDTLQNRLDLAWLLLYSVEPALRDPGEALKLAEGAALGDGVAPRRELIRAIALLRQTQTTAARTALRQLETARGSSPHGGDLLIRAWLAHQSGDPPAAARDLDAGQAWIKEHLPGQEESNDLLKEVQTFVRD